MGSLLGEGILRESDLKSFNVLLFQRNVVEDRNPQSWLGTEYKERRRRGVESLEAEKSWGKRGRIKKEGGREGGMHVPIVTSRNWELLAQT